MTGRLYRAKYPRTTKTFYCPFVVDQPDPSTDKHFRDFCNYALNSHVAYKDAALTITQAWWKRLPNYGKVTNVASYSGTVPATGVPAFRHAILTDPLYSNGGADPGQADDLKYTKHASGKRRAFNTDYSDGSALTYTDNNDVGRRVDRWTIFLDPSTAIQHNLDGGRVNFAVGGSWTHGVYSVIAGIPR